MFFSFLRLVSRVVAPIMLALCAFGLAQDSPVDSVIMYVNGEAVTLTQLKFYALRSPVGARTFSGFLGWQVRNAFITDIAFNRAIRQAASSVDVGAAEVYKSYQRLQQLFGFDNQTAFENWLEKNGISADDIGNYARETAQVEAFYAAKKKDPAELERYYKDNIKTFNTGERFIVRMIRVNRLSDLYAVLVRLGKGSSFQDVARAYSDINRTDGGLLRSTNTPTSSPEITVSRLWQYVQSRRLIDELLALQPNKVSEIYRIGKQFVILSLVSRSPNVPKPFIDVKKNIETTVGRTRVIEDRIDTDIREHIKIEVRGNSALDYRDPVIGQVLDQAIHLSQVPSTTLQEYLKKFPDQDEEASRVENLEKIEHSAVLQKHFLDLRNDELNRIIFPIFLSLAARSLNQSSLENYNFGLDARLTDQEVQVYFASHKLDLWGSMLERGDAVVKQFIFSSLERAKAFRQTLLKTHQVPTVGGGTFQPSVRYFGLIHGYMQGGEVTRLERVNLSVDVLPVTTDGDHTTVTVVQQNPFGIEAARADITRILLLKRREEARERFFAQARAAFPTTSFLEELEREAVLKPMLPLPIR
jgi:PPIC-type PPIASE domain